MNNAKVVLLTCLLSTAAYANEAIESRPCGLSGTVRERIADCNTTYSHKAYQWKMVANTQNGTIYRDPIGSLWAMSSNSKFNLAEAKAFCASVVREYGELNSYKHFQLPSIKDFELVDRNKFHKAVSPDAAFFTAETRAPKVTRGPVYYGNRLYQTLVTQYWSAMSYSQNRRGFHMQNWFHSGQSDSSGVTASAICIGRKSVTKN